MLGAVMMTHTNGLAMANSDYFILKALKSLEGKRATYEEIIAASMVKCDKTTVWRAIKRLEKKGNIEKMSRGQDGWFYKVLKDDTE